MLAFFPWLRLKEPLTVGEFTLTPYERGKKPAGKGTSPQNTLDAVTEPYLELATRPIRYATLLQFGKDDLTRDLNDQERSVAFIFSDIVAVSGLSCRQYFRGGGFSYWNRDNFQLIIQKFDDPHGGASHLTRRRDGSGFHYVTRDAYRVQKPMHVSLSETAQIDEPLLQALLHARRLKTWGQLSESIFSFNLASTDRHDMGEHVEHVLLSGALERLLNCNRGKEDELAERFTQMLSPSSPMPLGSCSRFAAPELITRFKKSSCVCDAWIRDFFHVRGDLAHGKVTPLYPSVWSLPNHLLLASVVYPPLLKKVLSGEGAYTFSEEDRFQIDLFEPLACEEHFVFATPPEEPLDYPWNRVIDAEKWRKLRANISARLSG
jgi:hypothetical protein